LHPRPRRGAPANGSFDAVVSGLAIHHLHDVRKLEPIGEIHGLLVPGGVFAKLDLVSLPLRSS
jgi:tRNA (cmo5U34)-methyltransferase